MSGGDVAVVIFCIVALATAAWIAGRGRHDL
jgi:hypothetical protein